jgi:hypothetical protein
MTPTGKGENRTAQSNVDRPDELVASTSEIVVGSLVPCPCRHSRPSMSPDVYSHVMPPDEVASERFLALIDA